MGSECLLRGLKIAQNNLTCIIFNTGAALFPSPLRTSVHDTKHIIANFKKRLLLNAKGIIHHEEKIIWMYMHLITRL